MRMRMRSIAGNAGNLCNFAIDSIVVIAKTDDPEGMVGSIP